MLVPILRWIYDITSDTPTCVLVEIARCRGVTYKSGTNGFIDLKDISITFEILKKSLEMALPFQINNINHWNNDDLRNVATYLNPSGKWRKEPLKKAYITVKKHNRSKEPPIHKKLWTQNI